MSLYLCFFLFAYTFATSFLLKLKIIILNLDHPIKICYNLVNNLISKTLSLAVVIFLYPFVENFTNNHGFQPLKFSLNLYNLKKANMIAFQSINFYWACKYCGIYS